MFDKQNYDARIMLQLTCAALIDCTEALVVLLSFCGGGSWAVVDVVDFSFLLRIVNVDGRRQPKPRGCSKPVET